MENEILDYIDDVRTEYPEVVADDESIVIQESDDIREENILQVSEKPILAVSEDKIENINEFKTMGVVDSANKSNVSISNSNDSNDIVSVKSVNISNLENYDATILWTNPDPTAPISTATITLDDSILNYDIFGVQFNYNTGTNDDVEMFFKPNDNFNPYNSNIVGGLTGNINGQIVSRFFYNEYSYGTFYIGNCYGLFNSATYYGYLIPTKIIGYNAKTLSGDIGNGNDNNNTNVSGNIINNNFYIGCLSNNSVSNDIIHKPLSEYSAGESMGAISMLLALAVGFVILIRKAVFRWH